MVTTNLISNLDGSGMTAVGQTNPNQSGQPSSFPLRNSIIRNSDGRLWVCYFSTDHKTLRVAYSDDTGTNWTLDTSLTLGTVDLNFCTQILCQSTGEPLVVTLDVTNRKIAYASRATSGTWTSLSYVVSTVYTNLVRNYEISSCLDSNDKLHILFTDSFATTQNARYITDVSGSFVQTTVFTNTINVDSFAGAIAADDQANVYVFYRYRNTGSGLEKYCYLMKTAAAAMPELNHDNGSTVDILLSKTLANEIDAEELAQIDMAIDADYFAHLTWTENPNTSGVNNAKEIYYATNTSGSWVIEQPEVDATYSHIMPSIAVTRDGIIYISWQKSTLTLVGDESIILATRSVAGSWSTQTVIGSAGENKCNPSLLYHRIPDTGAIAGMSETGVIGVYLDFDHAAGSVVDYRIFITDDWAPDDGPPIIVPPPVTPSVPYGYFLLRQVAPSGLIVIKPERPLPLS